MTTATSPVVSTGLNAKADPEVKKVGRGANGHDALDLAETAEASQQAADRLEARRAANEKARTAQRARFEEQMRQLEADHLAEEAQIADADSPSGANGNTTSAPTTPPGRPNGTTEKPAPIGQGREMANGAKSMPNSRRASGYGGTFGLEKLSLSVVEPKSWADEEDVDAAGAQSSVQYLKMNDDDPFPGIPKTDKRLSTASAALDLAPLSQTPPRAYGSRPFDTAHKTSEWPQFGAQANIAPAQDDSVLGAGRKTSPTGMADSITSLPAIPSKSVPGTPFGLSGGLGSVRRSGTSPNVAEGLTQSQRGFSNPDLARAFGKPQYGMDQPRPYGADPLYTMFDPNTGAPMGPGPYNPHAAPYDPYGFEDDGYGSGALYPGGSMGVKNKRAETDREFNRFAGVRIEDLAGELLTLCKDQHGCRYLQKKLEEGDPAHRDMIFSETYGHFPELMTDPFGNYLCQKLLEYSTEEQRSAIIDSVAGDLVGISLNMHGTRAVQKMVDFLAQPRQAKQIRTLIYALSVNVVALIKDLNGNHVIQKCLNKLIPDDNQFIYNAIAANLIEVATHRHGCCVLQRSIDHASPAQRVQLVTEIIFNSLYLVQDPFGNYVIQYILDLNDARFSEPLIRTFIGNVCSLSVQKFSSNVVEKCIRVADPEIRKVLVGEVLNRSRLEKLLRDSYGNYVIQTILDYCDLNQRLVLIEAIRPILPSIRNTPYGKRIQSKLAREDSSFAVGGFGGGGGGGGGRGGYRGGPGGGGPGGYQRHLGRPQLQHINALTEVYGSQGPYMPPGNHYMGPGAHGHGGPGGPGGPHGHGGHGAHGHGGHGAHGNAGPHPGQFREMPTHTGVAYHAPGPDGQPWLHLRGPAGGPAPNWNLPEGSLPDGQLSAQITGTGSGSNDQVLPDTAPTHPGAAGAAAAAGGWPTDPTQYYAQGPMVPHHGGAHAQHMM